ncbi:MAG: tetratricopeptide repeat protein, partial [Pseudomonadota bacterium]
LLHQQADHVDAALALSGDGGGVRPFIGLFGYQRAMALDYAGRTADADAAYAQAESGGLWLPVGIERYADLKARTGSRDAALAVLNKTDGRLNNPAVAADAVRLQAGQPLGPAPLTPARGAAIGLYGLAAVFLQESDQTHGLACLTLALMLDPGLDAARLSYAEAQVGLDHGDAARGALARVPAQSPYAESARIMDAYVLLSQNQNDAAVAEAESVAANGGPRAKRALADIYGDVGRDADAEPIYTALIDAHQADWRVYFSRGGVRAKLNRWADAEADLRHALELSPDQPEVLNYLGYSWIDRGEHLQEGLAMVQHAAELRPSSGAIVDSLGWAYFKLGDYDQAVTYLERAVELSPADSILNDHLGDAYWRAGRHLEARFQWRRALTFNPADADRPGIEAKVANGLPALPATRAATR